MGCFQIPDVGHLFFLLLWFNFQVHEAAVFQQFAMSPQHLNPLPNFVKCIFTASEYTYYSWGLQDSSFKDKSCGIREDQQQRKTVCFLKCVNIWDIKVRVINSCPHTRQGVERLAQKPCPRCSYLYGHQETPFYCNGDGGVFWFFEALHWCCQ